jgi:NADPH:quinone reductase-like Zn-dependent oxidoreductase
VILNGATGAIGGVVIQLCAMLKLRAIAGGTPPRDRPRHPTR